MTTIDPEKERQRLAFLYAGMSEGELEKLAKDEASLTDLARAALKGEVKRRGLIIPARDSSSVSRPLALANLVTLRKFRDLPEALVAKNILDSAGVECFLADENTVRMDWMLSNLLGGIKLWVRQEDANLAEDLLKQDFSEGYHVEGVGEYKQLSCPNCQSSDTSFEGLDKSAYVTLILGVPIPFKHRGWKCRSCGHSWQDQREDLK